MRKMNRLQYDNLEIGYDIFVFNPETALDSFSALKCDAVTQLGWQNIDVPHQTNGVPSLHDSLKDSKWGRW